MKTYLYILLILLLSASCVQKSDKTEKFTHEQIASLGLDSTRTIEIQTDSIITINLNPILKNDELWFDEKLKSLFLVPLETTNESLVSEIKDILVTDEHIYISDYYQGGSVLIFDKNGKSLKRITRGQGPEEILNLKGVAFDKDKQELIVYHHKILSFYTPDGRFKRRERLPFNAFSFAIIPDGYIFKSVNGIDNSHFGYSEDYQVLITDKDLRLKSIGFPYHYAKENNFEIERVFGENGGKLYFALKFTDTIYQYVDGNRVKAKYALDISDKSIPEYLLKESTFSTFVQDVKQGGYYFFLGDYEETDTHVYLMLKNFSVGPLTCIFFDKKSSAVQRAKMNSVLLPTMILPVTTKGRYFVSYYLPYMVHSNKDKLFDNPIISEEDKIKLKSVKDDDNPVLMFYEMESF